MKEKFKMKKLILPIALLMSLMSLTGCGTKKNSESEQEAVPQDPLDLGPEFNADYYPKKENNKVPSIVNGVSSKMRIDVALDFDGTEEAWQALADEYMRLCGNLVTVKLVTGLDTASYTERVRNEEINPKTDWDIIQGNLLNSASSHCVNLMDTIRSSKNSYAGNKPWIDVLEENAYVTDVTGSTDYAYYLNTENLSTAWFINKSAAAKANITNLSPKTWDEFIDVLQSLQDAGYKYPLGLSLNSDSINNSQFSWLLRIYGDYFFRQSYKYTSKTFDPKTGTDAVFSYDKTAENQESYSSFSFSYNRGLCMMLDESCPYFMGAGSETFSDFINQLSRLAKFIRPSSYTLSFNDVRASFMAQKDGNNGDEAPQVMVDYTGSGLAFLNTSALKENIDFFDYPVMESEYVEEGTLTRDVGGNGGYLALFNYANKKQQDLNKDFLKFVASPYGQTIYYKALSAKGLSPKGLTTVKNDLVVIPNEWREFFQSSKVTFTGLADSNAICGLGVVDFQGVSNVDRKSVELWQSILRTQNQISIEKFSTDWHYSLITEWPNVAAMHNWKEDGYHYSNFDNPNYIAG